MTFRVYKLDKNIHNLIREIGYKHIATTEKGELNCVRPLAGDYPRFHIYMKDDGEILTFNIHLDQKKPVYEGTTAHAGDYDGPVVETEVDRIKNLIFESS